MKNLLVAIDFEETSHHALGIAQEIAGALGARLHLLHVIPDPPTFWSFEASDIDMTALQKTWAEEATRKLAELDLSPTCERVATIGDPSDEIIRYAEQHGIDMIVVGTHGRSTIGEMLIGSVADKVIRRARCPVLSVRHPDHGSGSTAGDIEHRKAQNPA